MTENLAAFLLEAANGRPDLRIGVLDDGLALDEAVEAGLRVADALEAAELGPGARVAVVDVTSDAYFVFWIGCQLAGVEPALVNPAYPPELLADMLRRLDPAAVASASGVIACASPSAARLLGFAAARKGSLTIDGVAAPASAAATAAGLAREPLDTAGYMHTSGTEGVPKFCAQSHRYFVRLARYVADTLCLSPDDRVFAPLPAFHINPLGYGFLGALAGLADARTVSAFSASGFWPGVTATGITVLIMHGPPVEILKRRGPTDVGGHSVRAAFLADQDFLDRFEVPLAISAYGSTEAGGLSHTWKWRRGERVDVPEGMTRFGGRPRPDVEWALGDDGEILLRGREPGVLFSGYFGDGRLSSGVDAEGWLATGDAGRRDEEGRLVFIERQAESVRVKGEYVPLAYIEATFGALPDIADVAAWKRPGDLGDELVIYVAPHDDTLPVEAIREVTSSLPKFMKPAAVARVAAIPRDPGVRKVQRRRLSPDRTLEWVEL